MDKHSTSLFGKFCRIRSKALSILCEREGLFLAQPPVLSAAIAQPDITLNELTNVLSLAQASVTNNVWRMEKMGLITKTTDNEDARKVRINITDSGTEKYSAFEKRLNDFENIMFADFTADEKKYFLGYIKRVTGNMALFIAEAQE